MGKNSPPGDSKIPETEKTTDKAGNNKNDTYEPKPEGALVAPTLRTEGHVCFLSVASLVVSVLTLLAIIWYGWTARGQLEQMREATEASTKAADAATEQVAASKQSTQLDQRAWISIAAVRMIPNPPQPGKPITVEVGLKNTGKTPARNVVVAGVVEPGEPGKLPLFTYNERERVSLGVMAPTPSGHYFDVSYALVVTRRISTGEEAPATPEIIEQLESGKTTFYAHGRISYTDIFGKSHWTTYCVLFHRDQAPGSEFVFAATHNDMGDEP